MDVLIAALSVGTFALGAYTLVLACRVDRLRRERDDAYEHVACLSMQTVYADRQLDDMHGDLISARTEARVADQNNRLLRQELVQAGRAPYECECETCRRVSEANAGEHQKEAPPPYVMWLGAGS